MVRNVRTYHAPHRRRWLLASALLALAVGCSGKIESRTDRRSRDDDTARLPGAAPSTAVAPELPDVVALDRDGDRIDDLFFATPIDDERVNVEAIFTAPIGSTEIDAFTHAGGAIRHIFRAVSYGFTGTIARSSLLSASKVLGSRLLLLKADRLVELHLDEQTSTGRARGVWTPNFAGSALGFNGSPTINIAFLDTGIDPTHPDLAGRMVGWKDYTSEAVATARDRHGHGSHVAGIALGSGVAFGIGPGILRYTDHNNLAPLPPPPAGFFQNPIHIPPTFNGVFTSTATWVGGGTTELAIMRTSDGATTAYSPVAGPTTGASPLVQIWNGPNVAGARITTSLKQNAGATVGLYAIANTVTTYPAVGDGFPALRGVAPLSGWYAAKIFPPAGTAQTSDIAAAMDDIVVQRSALNIKVANLSFGVVGAGIDTTQRAKANTMVANGIVVVATNGNNGTVGGKTADPGRASNVITVGATNDVNQLTEYTSHGFVKIDSDEDNKPDILAPGGSPLRSRVLSVDSNTDDANDLTFTDVQADDYTSISGTSMSAPFIAGAAVLVIDALERSGTAWSFASTASPFLVKSLLLASATETNALREVGSSSPTLGRSAALKDIYEGYGIVNPDAAIEAVMLSYDGSPFTTSAITPNPSERRAWGRHMTIPSGKTLKLSLTVPNSADYDLYLYASTPGTNGNPILLASAERPAAQNETLTWRASSAVATTAWLFVKRVAGDGTFTLTGSFFSCGDHNVETSNGEQCDIGDTLPNDCCSTTCQIDSDGTPCTGSGSCLAGVCTPSPIDAGVVVDAGGVTPPPDASVLVDAGRDSGPRREAGSFDDGPELIPIDLTEGEVGGGGCAVTTTPDNNARTSLASIGALALAMLLQRRRRVRRADHGSPAGLSRSL